MEVVFQVPGCHANTCGVVGMRSWHFWIWGGPAIDRMSPMARPDLKLGMSADDFRKTRVRLQAQTFHALHERGARFLLCP